MLNDHTDGQWRTAPGQRPPEQPPKAARLSETLAQLELFDLFSPAEIQAIQDEFSAATGVSAMITTPGGVPLTQGSNFTRLCAQYLRTSPAGSALCLVSNSTGCSTRKDGPSVRPCQGAGLWLASAAIFVGDKHLANWHMGQVRADDDAPPRLDQLAAILGQDQETLRQAYEQVPAMPREQFDKLASILHLFANQLSRLAFKNFEQRQDIELRKRLETKLRQMALTDNLTGLPNRTLCLDRLAQALRRKQRIPGFRFSVLFLDLDRFNAINDSLGHAIGDFVLQEVGSRISQAVRTVDTVARLGGDEFVLLLSDIAHEREVIQIARRVLAAIQAPLPIGQKVLNVSASVGINMIPSKDDTPEELIRTANMAMHYAKKKKSGYIKVFTAKLHENALYEMDLETGIDRAIAGGEFFLTFQPIFEITQAKRLFGFESLLRWNHPEKGVICPGKFIPLAENTGRIAQLGAIALEESCRFMAQARACGAPKNLVVSVNVAPAQFHGGDLVSDILGALSRHGVPPSCLKLEITETTLLEGGTAVFDKISRLKSHGVKFSIDDFGVGYSNMSLLAQLPLDNLKIDISLVRLLDGKDANVSIVKAITTMASSLGLDVVAEGVETARQLELLKGLGCLYYQGFLLSTPLTRQEALALACKPHSSPPSA